MNMMRYILITYIDYYWFYLKKCAWRSESKERNIMNVSNMSCL